VLLRCQVVLWLAQAMNAKVEADERRYGRSPFFVVYTLLAPLVFAFQDQPAAAVSCCGWKRSKH
jgi:hypothetical protein